MLEVSVCVCLCTYYDDREDFFLLLILKFDLVKMREKQQEKKTSAD